MSKKERIEALSSINIESIAFGVRFQPRYEVLDKVGAVIDRILRTKGSPFDPKTFPLSKKGPNEHRLVNDDTGNELRLTQSDVILDMRVNTRKMSSIETLAQSYSDLVLENLREIAHLGSIIRYGVLFRLEECSENLTVMPAEHFIEQDFQDARSLSLRFTRRLPKIEALVRKDVGDYGSVIYTVKQSEESEVMISVDYQEYFEPELNRTEWEQKPFKDFVGRGINFFQGEFENWLKKMGRKDEAA